MTPLTPLEVRLGLAEADRQDLPGLYRLNAVYIPIVRGLGFVLLSAMVALHNAYLLEGPPPVPLESAVAVLLGYASLAGALLPLLFQRVRRVHLGDVFHHLDILALLFAIYASGGPRSWLVFLVLVRVADHRVFAVSRGRLLSFAHLPILGYLAVLLCVQYVDQVAFSWPAELTKLSFFYCINLYLALANALPLDVHRRVIETRDLIEQLEEKTRELAASRAHTQQVLNSAGEGMLCTDATGRTTFVNPAAARMLGWDAGELIGRPLHDVIHGAESAGSALPREECPACATILRGVADRSDDAVFRRRDGTVLPVEYVSNPIRGGEVVDGAVVVFKDATERRELERVKDEFIAIVSHEVRTPLTSIRGALGLLASGLAGPVPDRVRHLLDLALSNTDRLVRLLTDVLDYERLRSGKSTLRPTEADVADLVRQACDVVQPLAAEAGIELKVDVRPGRIVADPDRIVQALTNLLVNAIKFSAPDSPVHVGVHRERNEFVFRVVDEGRGIPAHRLERIFQRFEQVDATDSRERGGVGLGLAICRGIVEEHGGRIRVDSTEGRGSTFSFTIPVEPASDGTHSPAAPVASRPAFTAAEGTGTTPAPRTRG